MEKEKEKRMLQILNLLTPILCGGFIALLDLDFVSSITADTYSKLLSPAPFTFAIWGPIFIFQALFYFYQARDILKPPEERIEMPYVHEVSVFFFLSWASTTAWYALWGMGYIWPAIGAMYAYLITSLGAYLRLGINKRNRPIKEHLFVTVAWSMLTAWVTVAAIVNTTTGLVSIGFDPGPLGESGWTVLVLLMTLIIYIMVLVTKNDFVFAGVGLWAIIGVVGDRLSPTSTPAPDVTIVAILGALILVIFMIVWFLYLSRKESIHIIQKIQNSR
ncbi:MAG: conserved membrane protein of unknown function [Candidatus Thorarchaeota archaeon]|nr:MAG: conserved membrane protein of unknown function [Candidatus Thorarchaeota archaeon]